MDNKIIEEENNGILREILFVLKRNLLLILLITILSGGLGVVRALTVQHNYTASEKVLYMVDDKAGGTVEDINAMRAYIDTVVDFVDEGVVIDRANYYYSNWRAKKAEGQTIDEYITDVKVRDNYTQENSKVNTKDKEKSLIIDKPAVSVSTTTMDNYTQFFFSIRYTDTDMVVAQEKVKLLTLAFANELQLQDANQKYVYFSGLKIDIQDKGIEFVASDVSETRIVIIAILIGFILACFIIYVKNMFDNTVKDKQTVEQLTGAKLFSMLGKIGGESNGNK